MGVENRESRIAHSTSPRANMATLFHALSLLCYLLLSLLFSQASTAPLKTFLCCCGCAVEECPVVGFGCPNPRSPCQPQQVPCLELQSLYELSKSDPLIELKTFNLKMKPKRFVEDEAAHFGLTSSEKEEFLMNRFPLPSPDENVLVPFNSKSRHTEQTSFQYNAKRVSHGAQELANIKVESFGHRQKVSLDRLTSMIDELEEMMKKLRKTVSTLDLVDTSTDVGLVEPVNPIVVDPRYGRSPPKWLKSQVNYVRTKREGESKNCNDKKLGDVIRKNIKSKDVVESKRAIQKAAGDEFGGHFNVFCSSCQFSFLVASQKFCEGAKDDIACFAFLQPPTELSISN